MGRKQVEIYKKWEIFQKIFGILETLSRENFPKTSCFIYYSIWLIEKFSILETFSIQWVSILIVRTVLLLVRRPGKAFQICVEAKGCWKFRRPQKWPGCALWSHGNRRRTFLACYFYWPIMRMREKPRAAIRCYCLPLVHSSTTTISQYAKMKIFCLAHYSKANYIIQFMKLEWSVCAPFSP